MKGLLLNNWRLKLVAVLVSFGLWLYIYKEHNPQFSITHQVSIRYVNQDKALHMDMTTAPASVDVEFKGSPDQIQNIQPNKIWAEADLSGMDAGRHTIPLKIHHESRAKVVDERIEVNISLERLNSLERPVTVIPIGSLPIDKRLGTVRTSRDVVTLYGFEAALNKVSDATVSLYLTEQKESFSVRLPVEARDKFGNVVSGITAEPDKISVDVAVNNANTSIVPVNLNFNRGLDTSRVVAEYEPTTVTLFGKESSLRNIENVTTQTINAADCIPGATIDVGLLLPRNVFSADDTVTVTCQEPRTVERSFTVNIEIVHVPAGFESSLERDNDKIDVTVTGDAQVANQLNILQVKAQVDLTGYKTEGRHQVKPIVTLDETKGNLSLSYDHTPITVILKRK